MFDRKNLKNYCLQNFKTPQLLSKTLPLEFQNVEPNTENVFSDQGQSRIPNSFFQSGYATDPKTTIYQSNKKALG